MNKKPAKKISPKDHQKWQCIKPEQMKCDVQYALSINPCYQPNDYKSVNPEIEWQKCLFQKLATLQYCVINANMEISVGSRLHLHGYIAIKDIIEFFYKDIPRLRSIGSYEIDEINDEEIWKDYISKLKNHMEKWCAKYSLKYNYCDMNKHEMLFPKCLVIDKIKYKEHKKEAKEF